MNEDEQKAKRIFATLSPRTRTVLTMRIGEHADFEQIARHFSTTPELAREMLIEALVEAQAAYRELLPRLEFEEMVSFRAAQHQFLATARDKHRCHICLKRDDDPVHISEEEARARREKKECYCGSGLADGLCTNCWPQ